jgi:hypothetical protein
LFFAITSITTHAPAITSITTAITCVPSLPSAEHLEAMHGALPDLHFTFQVHI